jgi:hypothetical protein
LVFFIDDKRNDDEDDDDVSVVWWWCHCRLIVSDRLALLRLVVFQEVLYLKTHQRRSDHQFLSLDPLLSFEVLLFLLPFIPKDRMYVVLNAFYWNRQSLSLNAYRGKNGETKVSHLKCLRLFFLMTTSSKECRRMISESAEVTWRKSKAT